jgi:hypothetical protein
LSGIAFHSWKTFTASACKLALRGNPPLPAGFRTHVLCGETHGHAHEVGILIVAG